MTAAVYRWFSEAGALLIDASGAGLVACGICALCVLFGLVIAGAEYIPPAWRWLRRKLARWHAALVVTVVISALIAVVIWGTR